jgi:hypothetical protein
VPVRLDHIASVFLNANHAQRVILVSETVVRSPRIWRFVFVAIIRRLPLVGEEQRK